MKPNFNNTSIIYENISMLQSNKTTYLPYDLQTSW